MYVYSQSVGLMLRANKPMSYTCPNDLMKRCECFTLLLEYSKKNAILIMEREVLNFTGVVA